MPPFILSAIFAHVQGSTVRDSYYTFPCDAANLNLTLTIGGRAYPIYWADLIWRSEGDGHGGEGQTCFGNLYSNAGLTGNLQG
jgi:hypothetical protein